MRLRDMTPEELKQLNLQPVYTYASGSKGGRPQRILEGFRNISTQKWYTPEQFREVDTGHYNIKKAQHYQQELVDRLRASHFLTRSQLEKVAQADPRDVGRVLTEVMQRQQGHKVDVSTQVGTITVELGKQASGLLTLVKERQSANSRGHVAANTQGG